MNRTNNILDDVSGAIGFSGACALAGFFGGKNVYVPKVTHEYSPLTKVLTDAEFRLLTEEFGGQVITVPFETPFHEARRRRVIECMHAAGLPIADIAVTVERGKSTISRIIHG